MVDPDALLTLRTFRQDLYRCFERRRDALFELADAVLLAEAFPSLPYLSLVPSHRRGWGSVYAALARGGIDVERLGALLTEQPLTDGRPIYAVDVSVWPRCDAETSPERGLHYHPARHSAGQPIVAGWAYQWLAQLSFVRDSWTAPLDARRVRPHENVNLVAVEQIRALLGRLPVASAVPLFVFDAGYDPVQLTQGLSGLPEADAAVLVRLRSNRCFYADPTPAPPSRSGGRPRKHGAKLDCADPTTWPPATATHTTEDHQYGTVAVLAWANLHPKQQAHPTRGTGRPRPVVRGTLIRVEVTRLPGRAYDPQVLWLWWHGPGPLDLDLVWRAYVRRFDLEHTIRFVKQSLGWTTPRVRHPEQADRWTWLVLAAYTQLRLAKLAVYDQRLGWERRLAPNSLTPHRVRRAFSTLLCVVGTLANPPKPCGRSPGRPKGRRSGRAPRRPAIKKAA